MSGWTEAAIQAQEAKPATNVRLAGAFDVDPWPHVCPSPSTTEGPTMDTTTEPNRDGGEPWLWRCEDCGASGGRKHRVDGLSWEELTEGEKMARTITAAQAALIEPPKT